MAIVSPAPVPARPLKAIWLKRYACWICAGVYAPDGGVECATKGPSSNIGWATIEIVLVLVLRSSRHSRRSTFGRKERGVARRDRMERRINLELKEESPGWCNSGSSSG